MLQHQSGDCSEEQSTTQIYCIIRSSQVQAEHQFHAGCYFYTHFAYNIRKE